MKKTTKKKVEELPEVVASVPSAFIMDETIATLDGDFGREDLNKMRDKINELVNKLNG